MSIFLILKLWYFPFQVDKPLRMMKKRGLIFRKEGKSVTMTVHWSKNILSFIIEGANDVEWEADLEDLRRDSTASCSTPGGENRKHWNWDTSENARTQQRLKNMKGSFSWLWLDLSCPVRYIERWINKVSFLNLL